MGETARPDTVTVGVVPKWGIRAGMLSRGIVRGVIVAADFETRTTTWRPISRTEWWARRFYNAWRGLVNGWCDVLEVWP